CGNVLRMWICYRSGRRSVRVVWITVEIQAGSISEIPDIVGLVFQIPDFDPDASISIAGRALFPHQYPIKAGKTHLIGCLGGPSLFLLVGPEVFVISSLLSTARLTSTARQARDANTATSPSRLTSPLLVATLYFQQFCQVDTLRLTQGGIGGAELGLKDVFLKGNVMGDIAGLTVGKGDGQGHRDTFLGSSLSW